MSKRFFKKRYVNLKKFNNLREYLDSQNVEWRDKVFNECKSRCVITNQHKNVTVHHLSKSHPEILRETFRLTGLKNYQDTTKYTAEELDRITATYIALHMNIKGIVLAKGIHQEYHKMFKDISEETFIQFKRERKIRKINSNKKKNDINSTHEMDIVNITNIA